MGYCPFGSLWVSALLPDVLEGVCGFPVQFGGESALMYGNGEVKEW